MNRRGFLFGTSLTAAALAAGLSGCTDQTGQPSSREAGSGELPTRVPFDGVKPDLPELEGGVPPAYFTYPSSPAKRDGLPYQGASGEITALLQGNAAVTPRDSNTWWKKLEEASGFSFKIASALSADYTPKLQTTLAGGDIPDLVQIVNVPGLPGVLDKFFADLTPYLAGDAIKDYPGLASIPTETWKIPMVNGKIWGVAQPRPAAGRIASYRGDLFAKFGITEPPDMRDGQDFLEVCKQVTDTRNSIYAMGADPAGWMMPAMLEMMGAPNTWSEEGGKFTHAYETEVFRAALDQVTQMFKAGYLHPDSASAGAENYTWWSGGRTSIYIQSIAGWSGYAKQFPDWKLDVLTLPKWDGDGPADKHLLEAGYGAYIAIKKGSEERVKELLRFADFVASPFGTQEQLLVGYGVEGTHYKLQKGEPVSLPAAVTDVPPGLAYLGAQSSAVVYTPNDKVIVQKQYDYLKTVLPNGVPNPALGLYSEAFVTTGASAVTEINDLQKEIIVGRKPLSDWDAGVKRWLSATGEQQRTEYQEALQKK